MTLIMVIREDDFVMLSADNRVTTFFEGKPIRHRDDQHKILRAPAFGLLATFGARDLGKAIEDRLIVDGFDGSLIEEAILDERRKFAQRLPEFADELDESGVIFTYYIDDGRPQSAWLHPGDNDQLITDTGRLNAGIPYGDVQPAMDQLSDGMMEIRPVKDFKQKIQLCAALLTTVNEMVHAVSPAVSLTCDIAVHGHDNTLWACKKIDEEFRLIHF